MTDIKQLDELPRGRRLNGAMQAEMAGISAATICRLHRLGQTPWRVYKKIGTRCVQWMADSADVLDWLKANAREPETN
jgi:predicted DNA-binding transcriptional regulator AlpA